MKLVRSSHPAESNVLLLSYIFLTTCFFSYQMFGVSFKELLHWQKVYIGMFLTGAAVSIMVAIVWEEMLFSIKAIKVNGGMVFRNHRTKLKTQIFLYSLIPAIFCFIYFNFEVNLTHFCVWAAICMIPPVVEKIVSGINNYNDFLKLTRNDIAYKNNEKEGSFDTKDVQNITIIDDTKKIEKKILLQFRNKDLVTIDLHEMELDAFYDSIDKFIKSEYKHLLTDPKSMNVAG